MHLTDENIVEQYKKTVAQIYIDKESGNRELTSSEKTALEGIANQLGIYGGEAVYMARAILRIFVDEDLTFARRIAPEFYTNKSNIKSDATSNFIFPNPASKEVNFLIGEGGKKTLLIFNSFGSLVKSFEISKDLIKFTLNVEGINQGVYNVLISDENGISKNGRMVVVH